jgi:hypothetical protein
MVTRGTVAPTAARGKQSVSGAGERGNAGGAVRLWRTGAGIAGARILLRRPSPGRVAIEGAGGRPLIRNSAGPTSFRITTLAEGDVVFRGLDFELLAGTRSSIQALGRYPEIRVEHCAFQGAAGTIGVEAGTLVEGAGRMTVRNSSFRDGAVGTFAYTGGTMDVVASSFVGHGFRALKWQSGAFGSAVDNDVSPCGQFGCLANLSSTVETRGNRFAGSRTDVDPVLNHVVFYAGVGASGSVAQNRFDGCGNGQCFLAIFRAQAEVTGNTFVVDPAHGTRIAIGVSDGTIGQSPGFAARGPTVLATDNVIHAGGAGGADRNSPDSYALQVAGLLVENGGTLNAFRNAIRNANVGAIVSEWNPNNHPGEVGGTLVGGDNLVHLARLVIGVWNSSAARFRSNDFTD